MEFAVGMGLQPAWFQEKSGVRPILLADDVLGELDPERRRRFWATIDPGSQVIATGTGLPDASLGSWQVFDVQGGVVTERNSGSAGGSPAGSEERVDGPRSQV